MKKNTKIALGAVGGVVAAGLGYWFYKRRVTKVADEAAGAMEQDSVATMPMLSLACLPKSSACDPLSGLPCCDGVHHKCIKNAKGKYRCTQVSQGSQFGQGSPVGPNQGAAISAPSGMKIHFRKLRHEVKVMSSSGDTAHKDLAHDVVCQMWADLADHAGCWPPKSGYGDMHFLLPGEAQLTSPAAWVLIQGLIGTHNAMPPNMQPVSQPPNYSVLPKSTLEQLLNGVAVRKAEFNYGVDTILFENLLPGEYYLVSARSIQKPKVQHKTCVSQDGFGSGSALGQAWSAMKQVVSGTYDNAGVCFRSYAPIGPAVVKLRATPSNDYIWVQPIQYMTYVATDASEGEEFAEDVGNWTGSTFADKAGGVLEGMMGG